MIDLKPAIYSKSRGVNQLLKRLTKAPYQKQNSKEAEQGLVAEFILAKGPHSVGTLNEYFQVCKSTMYNIHCVDGNVIVERDENGKFIARSANIFQEMLNGN